MIYAKLWTRLIYFKEREMFKRLFEVCEFIDDVTGKRIDAEEFFYDDERWYGSSVPTVTISIGFRSVKKD